MIPPIRRPQLFGIAVVLAAFLLVEFVVAEHGKTPDLMSSGAQGTTLR